MAKDTKKPEDGIMGTLDRLMANRKIRIAATAGLGILPGQWIGDYVQRDTISAGLTAREQYAKEHPVPSKPEFSEYLRERFADFNKTACAELAKQSEFAEKNMNAARIDKLVEQFYRYYDNILMRSHGLTDEMRFDMAAAGVARDLSVAQGLDAEFVRHVVNSHHGKVAELNLEKSTFDRFHEEAISDWERSVENWGAENRKAEKSMPPVESSGYWPLGGMLTMALIITFATRPKGRDNDQAKAPAR